MTGGQEAPPTLSVTVIHYTDPAVVVEVFFPRHNNAGGYVALTVHREVTAGQHPSLIKTWCSPLLS